MPAIVYFRATLALLMALMLPSAAVHGGSVQEGSGPVSSESSGVTLASPAWIRLLPPTQPNSAAYMVLRNPTDTELRIVAAQSDAARAVELHEHVQAADGVMRMRQVREVVIPERGEVELKPGGLHLMLIDLVEPLQDGQVVPITLHVEGFPSLEINAVVRRPNIGSSHHHGHSD